MSRPSPGLRPKTGFVNLIATIIGGDWLAHLCGETREVAGSDQSAVFLHVIADTFGDRAFVKVVARGHQTGVTRVSRTAAGEFFGIHDLAQCAGQIGLDEDVADFRNLATGKKMRFASAH